MERKVDSGTVFDVDFGRRSDKGNFLAFEYPNDQYVSDSYAKVSLISVISIKYILKTLAFNSSRMPMTISFT